MGSWCRTTEEWRSFRSRAEKGCEITPTRWPAVCGCCRLAPFCAELPNAERVPPGGKTSA